MRVNIKTKNIVLDTTLRGYVQKKLVQSVEKLIGPFTDIDRVIDIEIARSTKHHSQGRIWRAEINVDIDGTMLRAQAVNETILAAIDEVEDEITRELKKFKSKLRTKQQKGARQVKNILKNFKK